MLQKVDKLVAGPPKFYKAKVDGNATIGEPIGVPVYLIFDLISNTSAGYALLGRDDFNRAMKALLKEWHDYLQDKNKDSNRTLPDWFSDAGLAVLQAALGDLTFDETFVTEQAAPERYKTWDSFFTREFNEKRPKEKDGKDVRPIAPQPTDQRCYYIYNPCESTVFRIARNVQERDTFWIKSQNYSLHDMLGVDKVDKTKYPDYAKNVASYVKRLEGGSVLQSFLSPQDFHRYHCPVEGTLLDAVVIEGTYYAVLPDEGAPEQDLDLAPNDPHGALIRSQPWLSISATRAVYIFEPKSPLIDLVAFVPIGMVEVSSITITAKVGKPINVGDELGMFHFGGSTYAMVIKLKDTNHELIFQDLFDSPLRPGQHRWIRSVVGQVWPGK